MVREWCAAVSLRFGATILKHFAVPSPKIMLRSLPEVVRSSENDKTSDHDTSSCLTYGVVVLLQQTTLSNTDTGEYEPGKRGQRESVNFW